MKGNLLWLLNQTAINAKREAVTCIRNGKDIPADVLLMLADTLEKEVAHYDLIHGGPGWPHQAEFAKDHDLLLAVEERTSRKAVVFRAIACEWGVSEESVAKRYYNIR